MKVANSVYFVNRLIKVTFWRLTVIGLHGSQNLLICICIYTYIYIYIHFGESAVYIYIYIYIALRVLVTLTIVHWGNEYVYQFCLNIKCTVTYKKWPDHIFRTSITIVIQTWHYYLLFDVTRRRSINKRHSCVVLASFIFK